MCFIGRDALGESWGDAAAKAATAALEAAKFTTAFMSSTHPNGDECGIGAFVEAWKDVELDADEDRILHEIEAIVRPFGGDCEGVWPVSPDRPWFGLDENGAMHECF